MKGGNGRQNEIKVDEAEDHRDDAKKCYGSDQMSSAQISQSKSPSSAGNDDLFCVSSMKKSVDSYR